VARAQAIGRGFELERQGKLDQAAAVYLATLRGDTGNLAALLGLERVLPSLGRLRELVTLVHRALARDSLSSALRGVELRTYAGLGELDSVEVVARRWAAAEKGGGAADEAPWREWAVALEDQRLFDLARSVLLEGRRTLHRPTALANELADLAQRAGEWGAAAAEWGRVVTESPAQLLNAVTQLDEVPAAGDDRDRVIRALTLPDAPSRARRLGALLLLGWGEPARAWTVLEGTLDPPSPETAAVLRQFAERAATAPAPGGDGEGTGAGRGSSELKRVRGLALARYADLVPPQLAGRARADAARAFLDAGDRVDARAVLERIAVDPAAPADAQTLAQAVLLEVLIADGQLDTATARLARLRDHIGGDAQEELRLRLARARIARGELDKADALLAGDSSVDALAVRGWAALYRGDLKGARQYFRDAGPYAGDRAQATERTMILALLQQVDVDRSLELGTALQQLARADSAGAVVALRRAAEVLPVRGGRADVLLLAGRVAAALGGAGGGGGGPNDAVAAQLFETVVRDGSEGDGAAAPAAELAWAQLLLRQLRAQEAVAHLEHLILTYPTSAVVPEARRELERAKGAIPRS
jgi:tetratricopeptide (TPR) repeat protein